MKVAIVIALLSLFATSPAKACVTIYVDVDLSTTAYGEVEGLSSRANVSCRDYFGNPWVSYLYLNHILNPGGVDGRVEQGWYADWNSNLFYTTPEIGTCYRANAEGDDNLGTVQRAGSSQVCFYGPKRPPQPGDQHSFLEPLILDLNGDGIHTTALDDRPVWFDLSANGAADETAWTNPATEEGILYYDWNGDHEITDGRDLFGDATILPNGQRATNGFEALAVHDSVANGGNGDSVISPGDRIWGRLGLWVDRNHDGKATSDERSPLGAQGVVEISLAFVAAADGRGEDASGNLHLLTGQFTQRVAGGAPSHFVRRDIHDVYFRVNPR